MGVEVLACVVGLAMTNRSTPDYLERSVPADAMGALESLVGRIMIHTALIGSAVDGIFICQASLLKARGVSVKMPHMLGKKLSDIETNFQSMPEMVNLQGEALPIIEALRRPFSVRNLLAHGSLSHLYEEPPFGLLFVECQRSDDPAGFSATQTTLELSALLEAAEVLPDLCGQLQKIAMRVAELT